MDPDSIHIEIAFLSPIHLNPSTLDQSRIKLLYQNPVDSYANRLKIKALVLQPLQVTFYQCKWDLLNGVSCSLLNCGDPFLTAWFQFRLVGNLASHLSWVNFRCFHLVYCVENARCQHGWQVDEHFCSLGEWQWLRMVAAIVMLLLGRQELITLLLIDLYAVDVVLI